MTALGDAVCPNRELRLIRIVLKALSENSAIPCRNYSYNRSSQWETLLDEQLALDMARFHAYS